MSRTRTSNRHAVCTVALNRWQNCQPKRKSNRYAGMDEFEARLNGQTYCADEKDWRVGR